MCEKLLVMLLDYPAGATLKQLYPGMASPTLSGANAMSAMWESGWVTRDSQGRYRLAKLGEDRAYTLARKLGITVRRKPGSASGTPGLFADDAGSVGAGVGGEIAQCGGQSRPAVARKRKSRGSGVRVHQPTLF